MSANTEKRWGKVRSRDNLDTKANLVKGVPWWERHPIVHLHHAITANSQLRSIQGGGGSTRRPALPACDVLETGDSGVHCSCHTSLVSKCQLHHQTRAQKCLIQLSHNQDCSARASDWHTSCRLYTHTTCPNNRDRYKHSMAASWRRPHAYLIGYMETDFMHKTRTSYAQTSTHNSRIRTHGDIA